MAVLAAAHLFALAACAPPGAAHRGAPELEEDLGPVPPLPARTIMDARGPASPGPAGFAGSDGAVDVALADRADARVVVREAREGTETWDARVGDDADPSPSPAADPARADERDGGVDVAVAPGAFDARSPSLSDGSADASASAGACTPRRRCQQPRGTWALCHGSSVCECYTHNHCKQVFGEEAHCSATGRPGTMGWCIGGTVPDGGT